MTTFVNVLLLISITSIWGILIVNVVLVIAGYIYYLRTVNQPPKPLPKDVPFVSVFVPAHDEGVVIVKTVESLLNFDYPHDKYEVIVINDNSTDNSSELLAELKAKYPDRNFEIINTDAKTGGKGKSNALNIALKQAKGSIISIYDADNTPERGALRILVGELCSNPKLGAAIGKFRTRNRNATLLTRFINIETLSFQWMAQAGRQQLFHLTTIPGTNYVIWRKIIEEMGGWDVKSLAEDTEVSFHLYMTGYHIAYQPKAVTWEQEPQTLGVWFHQRTRWVKGNIYDVLKYAKYLFKKQGKPIRFDLIYFLSVFLLLVGSLVVSDFFFILSIAGVVHSTLQGFSNVLWLLAIILFVISTAITLSTEKGELTFTNVLIIVLMYITYSQLWLLVAAWGMVQYIEEKVFHKKEKWYKTKRYS